MSREKLHCFKSEGALNLTYFADLATELSLFFFEVAVPKVNGFVSAALKRS